ncbi:MAG: AtpZ/AtpI family protein [Clostridiales bacterium]|nr:AtpZ/AtpI family protein [Clostridiales bacterium]
MGSFWRALSFGLSFGLTAGVLVGLGAWGGLRLDERWGTSPFLALLGILLGIALSIALLIRMVGGNGRGT